MVKKDRVVKVDLCPQPGSEEKEKVNSELIDQSINHELTDQSIKDQSFTDQSINKPIDQSITPIPQHDFFAKETKEFTQIVGFHLPLSLIKALDNIKTQTGKDKSKVVAEALKRFIPKEFYR